MPKKQAMIPWDEQFAKQAQESAAMMSGVGVGDNFSIKGGVLSFAGAPIPGNAMGVIIAGGVLHNTYFPDAYDSESAQAPKCYAYGSDEATMAPHEDVVKAKNEQSTQCDGCPMNEFGTAERGKGKACSNRVRLALLAAGEFDGQGRFVPIKDSAHFANTGFGFFGVPPTSLKGYAAFVNQIRAAYRRPPHAVFCRITVIPDPDRQAVVTFEYVGNIPDEIAEAVMARHEEALTAIAQPYPAYEPRKGKKAGRQAPAHRQAPTRRQAPVQAPAPAPRAAKASKGATAAGGFGGGARPMAAAGGKKANKY